MVVLSENNCCTTVVVALNQSAPHLYMVSSTHEHVSSDIPDMTAMRAEPRMKPDWVVSSLETMLTFHRWIEAIHR